MHTEIDAGIDTIRRARAIARALLIGMYAISIISVFRRSRMVACVLLNVPCHDPSSIHFRRARAIARALL